ncbi:DUF1254 domain-containing protein [Flavobacterium hibernum]|uniref:DUF1254 domain-containing protein n=1 Tax=Flavobacterium hibernum TaxID=37752 RepID=UPI000A01DC2C|nr:DUF1254 domain-containing protein [Flavobacterium hibernum]PTT02109.1 DUF1254 domain-containing protein [Flavobacterium sp. HMWF030]STO10920.1 Uncharacterized conserved protein [Flavobacterium hibernum]
MKKKLISLLVILTLASCNQNKNTNNNISVSAETDTLNKSANLLPPGPDLNVKITESYARQVARDAYFWAWPMENIYNRRLAFKQAPKVGLMNGVLPFAPLNSLAMLHDYIKPEQRWVACPNQDVVYGAAIAALDETPVIVQVPDFGDRFWVYQVVDLRTDSFAQLGKMYGTKPGFYLLVGPNWKGYVPKGITKTFRSKTGTAFIVPRVFQDDSPQDKKAIQSVINTIDVYALDKFDGKMKSQDWSKLPSLNSPTKDGGSGETKWVFPDSFFDELPIVLKDAPPLRGEESRYAQILAVIEAAKKDPALKKAIIEEAHKADKELIDPLLQFKNWGIPLANNWTTANNCAAFGTDYFTRTAIAKSNILVNASAETKYFYQDLDSNSTKLNGSNQYTVTFAKGKAPQVKGFWSLTLYDEHHFFSPNAIKRYSVGTKNKDLKYNTDGSLTLYVQNSEPLGDKKANWLPCPKGIFCLYFRCYWPEEKTIKNEWTPPAVVKT